MVWYGMICMYACMHVCMYVGFYLSIYHVHWYRCLLQRWTCAWNYLGTRICFVCNRTHALIKKCQSRWPCPQVPETLGWCLSMRSLSSIPMISQVDHAGHRGLRGRRPGDQKNGGNRWVPWRPKRSPSTSETSKAHRWKRKTEKVILADPPLLWSPRKLYWPTSGRSCHHGPLKLFMPLRSCPTRFALGLKFIMQRTAAANHCRLLSLWLTKAMHFYSSSNSCSEC